MLNRCGTDAWWMHSGCVGLHSGHVAESQQTQGGCTAEAQWMHRGCRVGAQQKRAVRTADAGRMQGSCTAAAWQQGRRSTFTAPARGPSAGRLLAAPAGPSAGAGDDLAWPQLILIT